MPTLNLDEQVLLSISTCRQAELGAFPSKRRHPIPVADLVRRVCRDRLALAGDHLTAGDSLVLSGNYRSSISRHYYAMYHAARAVVFAHVQGDDYERHSDLAAAIPSAFPDAAIRRAELTDARLLRNEADYDIYPSSQSAWEADARSLLAVAARFVAESQSFAEQNGFI